MNKNSYLWDFITSNLSAVQNSELYSLTRITLCSWSVDSLDRQLFLAIIFQRRAIEELISCKVCQARKKMMKDFLKLLYKGFRIPSDQNRFQFSDYT